MNIITYDLSNVNKEDKNDKNDKNDKKSKKSDNCQELKNIAYKTMLLNGTDINPKYDNQCNKTKISEFLENESSANKNESWSKLDKTQKIKHLYLYANILKKRDDLLDEEFISLKNYMIRCLERKCLLKTKEVIYDKETNKILNIPFLSFNEEKRIYILRKDDKHVSTIKSLPSTKISKAKTIKIYE